MAVDTRDKRASSLNYQSPAVWLFPNPDGSLATQADRQFVGKVFSGISASASSAADFIVVQSSSIGSPYATGTLYRPYATGTMKN